MRYKHMTMIRGKVRNTILIDASYAMEAKKKKYKFLVIQTGENFPFMKSACSLEVGGEQKVRYGASYGQISA